jgi:hypothetical protein
MHPKWQRARPCKTSCISFAGQAFDGSRTSAAGRGDASGFAEQASDGSHTIRGQKASHAADASSSRAVARGKPGGGKWVVGGQPF